MATSAAPVRPTKIAAPHGATCLTIEWSDGVRQEIPHDIVRGLCPCASCQGHGGGIRYQNGGNLELIAIERVGNYALTLRWGDGHDSGIYTFRYLRRLGDLVRDPGPEALKAAGISPAE